MPVERTRVRPLGGAPRIAMLKGTRALAGLYRPPRRAGCVARLGFGGLLRMSVGMRVRMRMRQMRRIAMAMQRLCSVRGVNHLRHREHL